MIYLKYFTLAILKDGELSRKIKEKEKKELSIDHSRTCRSLLQRTRRVCGGFRSIDYKLTPVIVVGGDCNKTFAVINESEEEQSGLEQYYDLLPG